VDIYRHSFGAKRLRTVACACKSRYLLASKWERRRQALAI
jgi:hypothetical protein